MTTQASPENIIKTLFDRIDRQDWPAVLEMVAPSVRVRAGGHDLDRDGWLGMGKMFYAGFPDGKHDIQSCIVQGDTVAARGVWRGTHRGEFQGVPASGRSVAIDFLSMERVVEGRIVEHHAHFDALSLMQQIGALPG